MSFNQAVYSLTGRDVTNMRSSDFPKKQAPQYTSPPKTVRTEKEKKRFCEYLNKHLFQQTFRTGTNTFTPVSNTMLKLYSMTKYLRPDLLKDVGVERFYNRATTFGKVVIKNLQTSAGALKLKTGFAKFAHLPELMKMYKEFADIQSAEKLSLPRPKLKTSRPQTDRPEVGL